MLLAIRNALITTGLILLIAAAILGPVILALWIALEIDIHGIAGDL